MDVQKTKGAEIDILAQMPEEAAKNSLELMHEKGISSVFFLTSGSRNLCRENKEVAELISSCDMILPGDKATEEVTFSKGGLYVKEPDTKEYLESYFEYLLYRLDKENRVIFVIAQDEQSLERYKTYMSRYKNVQTEGLVFQDYDKTVNEINAVIPDILLLGVPIENQFVFLKEYASMMNTKLIIGMDVLNQYLKRMTQSVPPIIKALHLENVYHWIKKDSKPSDVS